MRPMKTPDFPENEELRLETLKSLEVLDTEAEERFDRITRLAKRLFNVPISLVSIVDEDRQWFKSCYGLTASETHRDISFCGHSILGDETFVVPNALEDSRFADNPLVTGDPNIRFYAGFPLKMVNDTKMGTLCIIDTEPREFTEDDRAALEDLAKMVRDELISFQLATLDELTGISNRRGFLMLAQKGLAHSARYSQHAYLVYLDLDNFKKINDEYGHTVGDAVIKAFADIMGQVFRESDVFGRIGGDEFAVLINAENKSEVEHAIQRLEDAVSDYNQSHDKEYQLNFSHGSVSYQPQFHFDIMALMQDADQLMYQHKKSKK